MGTVPVEVIVAAVAALAPCTVAVAALLGVRRRVDAVAVSVDGRLDRLLAEVDALKQTNAALLLAAAELRSPPEH